MQTQKGVIWDKCTFKQSTELKRKNTCREPDHAHHRGTIARGKVTLSPASHSPV